jgi:hypothetical protein
MKKIVLAATAALLLGGSAIADERFGLSHEVVERVRLKAVEHCKKNVIHYANESECIRLVVAAALELLSYKYAISQPPSR